MYIPALALHTVCMPYKSFQFHVPKFPCIPHFSFPHFSAALVTIHAQSVLDILIHHHFHQVKGRKNTVNQLI